MGQTAESFPIQKSAGMYLIQGKYLKQWPIVGAAKYEPFQELSNDLNVRKGLVYCCLCASLKISWFLQRMSHLIRNHCFQGPS